MVTKSLDRLYQVDEYEKAVLGCILIAPECLEEAPELTFELFLNSRNHDVFQAISALRTSQKPIDTLTVAEQLEKSGCYKSTGGATFLNELMEAAPNIINFSYYVEKLQERHTSLELRKMLEQGLEDLKDGEKANAIVSRFNNFDCGMRRKKFQFLTAAELHNGDFDVDYFIPDIFAKKQPLALVGPQKGCKTNIASDLVISLATGHRFLGHFSVSGQYRVAFISCESGAGTLKENNERVAKSKGILPSKIENLFYCFDVPSLDSQSDLAHLQMFVQNNQIDVLVIDPFYLTANLGNDASNLFVVGEKLKPLTLLMQNTGCTVVLVHHTRKNTGKKYFSEPRMEDIAYSGLSQWMRQWILLDRREQYNGDNPGSNKLWFSAGGSAGHSALFGVDIEEGVKGNSENRKWEVKVVPAAEARVQSRSSDEQYKDLKRVARIQTDIKSITEFLQLNPNTKTKIREATGITPTRIEQAMCSLLKEGAVEPCKVIASNNQKYDGYKLTGSFGNSPVKTTDTQHSNTHTENTPIGGSVGVCVSSPDNESLENIFPANSNCDILQGADH